MKYNEMVAFNEQAALYEELGMYDKALEMNRKSIEYALRNEKYNLGDAYRVRANIYQSAKQPDSIFHYFHLGLAAGREI